MINTIWYLFLDSNKYTHTYVYLWETTYARTQTSDIDKPRSSKSAMRVSKGPFTREINTLSNTTRVEYSLWRFWNCKHIQNFVDILDLSTTEGRERSRIASYGSTRPGRVQILTDWQIVLEWCRRNRGSIVKAGLKNWTI